MKKTFKKPIILCLIILIVLLIPSFWRMLKPGIFSMQDFHIFRLFEYERCLKDFQIPCRFSPDVAFGYGEPLFNFYGQLPYVSGELFRLVGFSFIDSIKLVFIISLIGSAITMFLAAKEIWKNNLAALINAVVYVYAPYRAVDIFVRGALPESFSFILFPLIVYYFQKYLSHKKNIDLLLWGFSFSLLILNHNLSAVMFSFFFIPWAVFCLIKNKNWQILPNFFVASVLVLGLCAFYLLPILAESNLVTLEKTTQGYFDFRAHFVTLYQLLISRTWGYGGSTWGNQDNLSLSIGQVQWLIPILVFGIILVKRKTKQYLNFLILFLIGWLMLFLTHNKSTFFWELVKPMAYIQFPWRFLGISLFCFALASGTVVMFFNKKMAVTLAILIITSAVVLNSGFFFEDLWFNISDKQQFSGQRYLEQTSASINDYWPKYGKDIPTKPAPSEVTFTEGIGSGSIIKKTSNNLVVSALVNSTKAEVAIPAVYFPGWTAYDNGQKIYVFPSGDLGLMAIKLDSGPHQVYFKFENTKVRTTGNFISIISLITFISLLGYVRYKRI